MLEVCGENARAELGRREVTADAGEDAAAKLAALIDLPDTGAPLVRPSLLLLPYTGSRKMTSSKSPSMPSQLSSM